MVNFSNPHFGSRGCLKRSENDGNTNEDAMKVIDRYHLDGLKRKKT